MYLIRGFKKNVYLVIIYIVRMDAKIFLIINHKSNMIMHRAIKNEERYKFFKILFNYNLNSLNLNFFKLHFI